MYSAPKTFSGLFFSLVIRTCDRDTREGGSEFQIEEGGGEGGRFIVR